MIREYPFDKELAKKLKKKFPKNKKKGNETPEHNRGKNKGSILGSIRHTEESKGKLDGIDDYQQNESYEPYREEAI